MLKLYNSHFHLDMDMFIYLFAHEHHLMENINEKYSDFR